MSKIVSLETLVMEAGIGPLSLFQLNRSTSRLKSEHPMCEGRLPENSLNESRNSFKLEMLNIEDGIEPDKELLDTWKNSRNGRVPISLGNSPVIDRDMHEVI